MKCYKKNKLIYITVTLDIRDIPETRIFAVFTYLEKV